MNALSSPADAPAFRFPHLPLARLRFLLRARQSCALPAYLGSTLRGAFGHALKRAACSTAHGDCARCLLTEACAYTLIFEGTASQAARARRDTPPHPFVLRPPHVSFLASDSASDTHPFQSSTHARAGDANRYAVDDELMFEILLVGEATRRAPYVARAVQLMADNGLGCARAPFDLDEVQEVAPDETTGVLYRAAHFPARASVSLPQAATLTDFVHARYRELLNASDDEMHATAAPRADGETLKLRLLTPMRLRVEGELRTALDFELLLRNVMRRLHLLLHAFSPEPFDADYRSLLALATRVRTRASRLTPFDLERYSNRQQSKQKLDGFLGEVEYAGDELHGFVPLMLAGELLHVGAATVFGFGRYAINR